MPAAKNRRCLDQVSIAQGGSRADIEKVFLMVSVAPRDREALRFLWLDDVTSDNPKEITYQFCRVVFEGIRSHPKREWLRCLSFQSHDCSYYPP